MGDWCHISTAADLKTIRRRIEHEGLSFLTITLPNFGKDLQKGLSRGFVAHDLFVGFSYAGGLPRFLGGFLELVFDRGTGVLLDSPSIDAIRAVHQLTSMFGKIELPCSQEREDQAIDRYVECEQEVREGERQMTSSMMEDFKRVGHLLFADVFSAIDLKVYKGEHVPRHGPGATADRLRGNAKYRQKEWTSRLEEYFPAGEFLIPNWRYQHELVTVDYLEPRDERPVRVITVPKTLKTPRIIAVEPTCMQYAQQSLMELIYEAIEGHDTLSRFIGFTDQEPNQLMAQEGSRKGNLATLDLSEASDRVSNQHVRALLHRFPHFAAAVDACRSRKADVPRHGVIRLAKFASMGSALCFPFEAMVFLTIIFLAVEQELNTPLTPRLIKEFRGKVRVYGDDIIVPVHLMERVSTLLSAFGLKVNVHKSFGTGKFRESCGGDYYDGVRITPVRVRNLLPKSRRQTTEVISAVSLRNQLWETKLFPRAVDWLDRWNRRVLPFYPEIAPTSSVLGRHTETPIGEFMCSRLQAPFVKGLVVKSRLPKSTLEDYGALMKWFLKRGEDPFQDPDHFMFAGRPVSVDTKTRKAPVR